MGKTLKLNADELGEKGESRFKEICADAKLICNKSDRDRAGWDFIVEFPFEDKSNLVPLEDRPIPLSCHVQVKTIRAKNDKIALRLSSAERISKELKPAFIYIFRVDDDLNFLDSYLIHLLNEPLAKVLKSLRKKEAESETAINKETISFSINKMGTALAPSGMALRTAIENNCKNNLHAYVIAKKEQLHKLGYDAHPLQMKADFHLNDIDEAVDMFLGIKKDVPVSNVRAVMTRFGIALPDPKLSQSGKITISPTPADSCIVKIQQNAISEPYIFKGQVFVPGIPGLAFEDCKFHIKCDFFSIFIKGHTFTFETNIDLPEREYTPQTWANIYGMLAIICSRKGTVNIKSDKGITFNIPIDSAPPSNPDICTNISNICQLLADLFKLAGTPDIAVKLDDIEYSNKQIAQAHKLFKDSDAKIETFLTERKNKTEYQKKITTIFADGILLGEHILYYDAVAELDVEPYKDQLKWQCASLRPRSIQTIKTSNEYESLVRQATKETGIDNVMYKPLDKNIAQEDSNLETSA